MEWQLQRYDGTAAKALVDDLIYVYSVVYGVPPYHRDRFFSVETYAERLYGALDMPGFETVTARRESGALVGYVHGVTLSAERAWWESLADNRPAHLQTAADAGDVFWLRELMVLPSHTHQGVGRLLHDTITSGRREHHTTLTCITDNQPAHGAYLRWGYTIMGRIQHSSDSPVYDAMYVTK